MDSSTADIQLPWIIWNDAYVIVCSGIILYNGVACGRDVEARDRFEVFSHRVVSK